MVRYITFLSGDVILTLKSILLEDAIQTSNIDHKINTKILILMNPLIKIYFEN